MNNSMFGLEALRAGVAGMVGAACWLAPLAVLAQPDPQWLGHDRSRPAPAVVDAGTASTPDRAGRAPSDAVVLFDGKDLSAWASMDGSPTRWIARDGYMECVQGSGYIRTLECFGDCQLHVEYASPVPASGDGQGRGNSGVFFGLDRYEVQVLDSFGNRTYSDGSAGSVYGQYPPLVNASRPPGQWQSFDILYTAPRFQAGGQLISPARMTVFHNGVLVQNNVELTGPTSWLERAPYSPHPEKTPISLQDHGNPVRYRNIWVRELGKPARREFMLARSLLDSYAGTYEVTRNNLIEVARAGDQLQMRFHGVSFLLFAESPTHFFAKTTDVQCDFQKNAAGQTISVSVGEGAHVGRKSR